MVSGSVVAICIGPTAKGPMKSVEAVRAIAGAGLEGDRYCAGVGSFSKGTPGRRQVTLMNALFFPGSGFEYVDTRRNLFTRGIELMDLIGKEFKVDEATLKGLKYCDPCDRPSKLSGHGNFREKFYDRGGLVAEILEGGMIRINGQVIPPPKNY